MATREDGFGSPSFVLNVTLNAARTAVNLEGAELNPKTSEFDEWDMIETVTDAAIERIAMRHANEWFVALRLDSGAIRIERWDLGHTPGAYRADRRCASSGIGTSIATPALVVCLEGNQYVEPARRARPSITKTPVVSDFVLDSIEKLAVDPDGRYLIADVVASSGHRRLLQIALIASSAIAVGDLVTLWDYDSLPEFRASSSIGQLEHPTNGRAIVLRDMQTSVCLWDSNNDGVFETHEVFPSMASWVVKYPNTTWSRSF